MILGDPQRRAEQESRKWLTGSQMRKKKGKAIIEEANREISRKDEVMGRTVGRVIIKEGKENDMNKTNVHGTSSRSVAQKNRLNKNIELGPSTNKF